ncbi:MAG: hypothetical protein JEZ11_13370 [Desulfobacterales bacterium]|nr:hypothetical protein [Desulfobacterales bacterium]
MERKTWVATLMFAAIFCFADTALAHRVNIFAWVEGNTVHTQSKFGGGRKAMDAPIEVYDDQDNKLLEGRTDGNGEFSFKIPKQSALKIVLVAGMGHRNEWTVPLDEIVAAGAPMEKASGAPQPGAATASQSASREGDMTGRKEPPPQQISEAMIKRIELAVEKAVERKIQPVTRMLAESRSDKPSLTDIFGGLGYILGLVGIGAYVHSRKKGSD